MGVIYSFMGGILKYLYFFLEKINMASFALAIVLFTLLINLVFLPLNIRQQKTSSKQTAIRPKLDALKEKCGDDRQKYSVEMQELYQREGVKMMGGCLPTLIRLPFLWGVWQAIRCPVQYILGLGKDIIEPAKTLIANYRTELTGKLVKPEQLTELDIIKDFDKVQDKFTDGSSILEKITSINFNLFGKIDLAATPEFTFRFSELTASELLLWLVPLFAFATSMFSSVISMNMQKKLNPDAPSMGCMMIGMPIMSLVIAFSVPAAVGFYWGISNLVSMVISIAMNKYFSPYQIIAKDEAKLIKERRAKEAQLEKSKNN